MKTLSLTLAILLAFGLKPKAQAIEKEPMFPGGYEKFVQFVRQNLKPTGDKGRVHVSFSVEKDGSLSGIQAVRGPSAAADSEAVRVVRLSPKWLPAVLHGVPIKSSYTVPVTFE